MVGTAGAGYSATAPTEKYLTATHRTYVADTARGCMLFHGSTATYRYPLSVPYGTGAKGDALLGALTRRKVPVLSADFGGLSPWAKDTAITVAGEGFTFFTTSAARHAQVKADGVLLCGFSMGAANALNWAKANLSKVRAIALCIPVTDMADAYDNDRGPGLAAQIASAYTNEAGWLAAEPAKNPINFADDFAGIPVGIWYATDDAAVPVATVTAFQAAVGASCEVHSLGTAGHTASAVPSSEVADFLARYV